MSHVERGLVVQRVVEGGQRGSGPGVSLGLGGTEGRRVGLGPVCLCTAREHTLCLTVRTEVVIYTSPAGATAS